jgi:hypothetical protein
MSSKHTALMAAAALVATQALAGIYYEAKTTAAGRKGADMQNSTVKAWVAGDRAKVLFTDSENPMTKSGMYMITVDGGKTAYMVNPEDKQYFEWDIGSLAGMAGGMMKMMNLKITDPRVVKLKEEAGDTIAGLPTVHYTYQITYGQSMKFMMIKKNSKISKVQEVWTAPKLVDKALGAYLRKEPPSMGDPEFDRLIRAEMAAMQGFPLRMKTVQTDTDEKGKSETTTTIIEVTKLELEFATPDSTFAIPPDYEKVEMPAMMGPGGQQK